MRCYALVVHLLVLAEVVAPPDTFAIVESSSNPQELQAVPDILAHQKLQSCDMHQSRLTLLAPKSHLSSVKSKSNITPGVGLDGNPGWWSMASQALMKFLSGPTPTS